MNEEVVITPSLPDGTMSEAALAQLRSLVGVRLRPERYIREATVDTITNFCNGIGDLNALHRNLDHAAASSFGSLVAPHCFLYVAAWPGRTRYGLPGVHGFLAGNDFRFRRRARLGDRITVIEQVVDVTEKASRFSGQLVVCTVEARFLDAEGSEIARCLGWNTRHERAASRERSASRPAPPIAAYSEAELREIEDHQIGESERIRGAATRYWEDVVVGEQLEPLVRGPLSMSDITAFLVGCGRGRAHGVALREARRHPDHYFRNPAAGGALEYTGMGHHLDGVAEQVGVGRAYDYGPQRLAWLGTLIEYWMGDDGELRRLRGELRGFNLLGDTTRITGVVAAKRHRGHDALVDIDITGRNQRGEPTTVGRATVALPSRQVDRSSSPRNSELD